MHNWNVKINNQYERTSVSHASCNCQTSLTFWLAHTQIHTHRAMHLHSYFFTHTHTQAQPQACKSCVAGKLTSIIWLRTKVCYDFLRMPFALNCASVFVYLCVCVSVWVCVQVGASEQERECYKSNWICARSMNWNTKSILYYYCTWAMAAQHVACYSVRGSCLQSTHLPPSASLHPSPRCPLIVVVLLVVEHFIALARQHWRNRRQCTKMLQLGAKTRTETCPVPPPLSILVTLSRFAE